LERVDGLVQGEVQKMVDHRKNDLLAEKHKRDAERNEATRMAQLHSVEQKLKEITRRQERFRRNLLLCLDIIRGGADVEYMKLRKELSSIPVDKVCGVLKNYKFPRWVWHGHTDQHYMGPKPDESGAVDIFFDSAKDKIFECVCDRPPALPKKPTGQASHLEQLAESFEKKLEEALGGDPRNIPKEKHHILVRKGLKEDPQEPPAW